ncbi:HlyD family efflux transporter periplasmic adaptor subunit [Candidatus Berkiella aquae]|uniref:Colicin V secretion protein CvaA n=1 Tax=Candidatus Berkiella aquae TaxID=295108 RepID=A0A0Q9YP10_9GAMM|nr:HlyD family efflux transporter periplasmic adaptor subunit [Candidatus Berkiella aquae]MCS5712092.1 HlyD family efflux transporter periplasmic adaptor subunit [Candidatus Berkiella aquae]
MSSSLFRKEALEHRKDRLYGDVILLQPLSMTVLVSIVVFVCLMILAILFWGSYARKETVHGYLVPDKGIVKTYAPQVGTISHIHIREGDEVKEGDTLITLLSERSMQGGSDIDTLLLKELTSTQAHQLERIKAEKSLLTSEKVRLNAQIDGLKKELGQIEQSLKAQEDRMQILQTRVDGAKKLLDSKNLSQNDYQKIYEEFLIQKQQYQELLRAKSSRQSALSQTRSELEQLPIKSESRINEIENTISEIKQRHAEVAGRRALEIRSPIAGTVTALQAREGQWQATNTPLLAIMPKDALLQVELFVPSRAIGFIAKDQRVKIRFDAFPYQRFGIYEGHVAIISKHVLLPSELPAPLVELKEPVYRLTVNLSQQHVNAYGKAFALQAGMSLEADIILENQTLFQWVLDPLTSLKGRFS